MTSALCWAALLLAVAAFPVIVIRRHPPQTGSSSEPDLIIGFVYTGAAALVALALAVIVVAVIAPAGARADSLAVLGLFGYAGFQLIGLVLWYFRTRRPLS